MPGADNAGLTFFRQWLRAPGRMGSIAPSGDALARAMARRIPTAALDDDAPIIELGGGTGSITQGLLNHGVPIGRLIVVERDPALAELLRDRFAGLTVLCGDASALRTLLAEQGIGRVAAIVSGLPLLLFSDDALGRLIRDCFSLLGEERPLIQFTYGLKMPLPAARYGLSGVRREFVLRNLPPAFVWTFIRAASAGS